MKHLTLVVVALLAVACSDKEDQPEGQALEEEEAVELVQASLEEASGGLTLEIEQATELALAYAEVCSYDTTQTMSRENALPNVQYGYQLTYEARMNCSQLNMPQSFEFSFSSVGNLNSQRFASQYSAAAELLLTGLALSEDALSMSGTYTRISDIDADFRSQRGYDGQTDIGLQSLIIDKTTQAITSGLATFSFQGTAQDGATFSYTGSIEFLGNQQATLTVNGNTYPISL